MFLIGSTIHAATITVTTTTDEYDTGPDCSLREAVQAANTNADFGGCDTGDEVAGAYGGGADVIVLGENVYTLTLGPADAGSNATGSLYVASGQPLEITGASREGTVLDADRIDRAIRSFAALELSDLTIRNGFVSNEPGYAAGGGVEMVCCHPLTMDRVIVEDNEVLGNVALGGGVMTHGLVARHSIFRRNQIASPDESMFPIVRGAGVYLNSQTDTNTIAWSSIHSNVLVPPAVERDDPSMRAGGGLFVELTYAENGTFIETADISNTTISGNRAPNGAGIGSASIAVCFEPGTLVATEDGPRPIEDIKAGDLVWAYDEACGRIALKKVLKTLTRSTRNLATVRLANGEVIKTTPDHPFWVKPQDWRLAADLIVGDEVLTQDGTWITVDAVEIHRVAETDPAVTVHNLTIEDFSTFFVSGSKVLVHNR